VWVEFRRWCGGGHSSVGLDGRAMFGLVGEGDVGLGFVSW
jgi:hypothetical protein